VEPRPRPSEKAAPAQEAHRLWRQTCKEAEAALSNQSYLTWIAPTEASHLDGETLYVWAPNSFSADWLHQHYLDMLQGTLRDVSGKRLKVRFLGRGEQPPPREQPQPETPVVRNSLNPKFTFESFVVGQGNELAHAACVAVSQRPGVVYNPLFLYGGTGLGKTHVMQAIGQEVTRKNPKKQVSYVPAEMFTNEIIEAIMSGATASFRNRYRRVDLLLLDDIHFLEGRERTQEEFFHTFNYLQNANSQVVVTSDRPPEETKLEARLISRFQSGLVADIQPPDTETRAAILRTKAAAEGVQLADEVVLLFAQGVRSNVRQLEGCLVRLVAMSSVRGEPITVALAREVLGSMLNSRRRVTAELIQKVVAKKYSLPETVMRARRRTAAVALPRQVAMYLCRQATELSLAEIGKAFGGRDHTTVMYACGKVERLMEENQQFRRQVENLLEQLRP
jgi:chromosomal replication initiator protein